MIETKLKYKKQLVTLASLLFMLAMIANPGEIISSAKAALELCVSSLVPSIFPFMVASSVFINYSSQDSFKALAPFLKLLFGTSPCAAAAIIPGMICGYPVGASCACQLYKNNMISKSEAESLIAFSNNSGPLFIIGAVGTGILHCTKAGIMLYIIHIVSAIICGILLKPFTRSDKNAIRINLNTSSKNFTDCVSDSTLTILKICGFVVIFAVINRLLSPAVDLLPNHFKCIAAGFLELTNASSIINENIIETKTKLILLSGALGWSGMSVHMQVKSIISSSDLSMKKYYATRLCSCVISMTISYFIFENPTLDKNTLNIHSADIMLVISAILLTACALWTLIAKNIKNPSR